MRHGVNALRLQAPQDAFLGFPSAFLCLWCFYLFLESPEGSTCGEKVYIKKTKEQRESLRKIWPLRRAFIPKSSLKKRFAKVKATLSHLRPSSFDLPGRTESLVSFSNSILYLFTVPWYGTVVSTAQQYKHSSCGGVAEKKQIFSTSLCCFAEQSVAQTNPDSFQGDTAGRCRVDTRMLRVRRTGLDPARLALAPADHLSHGGRGRCTALLAARVP